MVNPNSRERIAAAGRSRASHVDGTDACSRFDAVRGGGRARTGGRRPAGRRGAVTLRIHGHAAHDDARYVPDALRDEFARDPVERLAARLAVDGLSADELDALRAAAAGRGRRWARGGRGGAAPDPATLEHGVWAAPPG